MVIPIRFKVGDDVITPAGAKAKIVAIIPKMVRAIVIITDEKWPSKRQKAFSLNNLKPAK